ncbi:GNAT family N-acetyltransferase [Zhihengliuella flava]|uniref:Acetyltransferase n=1 Tax=Zhihengliuella flava TaxID=1285193 RepID=A0A931GFD7_9MICC|nr:GNAT family N-acetyltransferase [Zhihengliuella flava]MBG6085115.1 putative acetyltransferase [Zhihengliuella flava]
MTAHITRADFDDPRLEAFLAEHLRDMLATSPAESVHALDLTKLNQPSVRLWVMYEAEVLACTGALARVHDEGPGAGDHEELKSMRTQAALRGRGLARRMLEHLVADARDRGVQRLSLETGTEDYFAPARAMYRAAGFVPCAPFGTYTLDPNSVFMTRALA